MMKKNKVNTGFGTLCVGTIQTEKKIKPHNEPIYATSAYLFDHTNEAIEIFKNKDKGFTYSRWANPTVELCEKKIAMLESFGSQLKTDAQLFSSGMAAITAALLSCLSPGDSVLTQHIFYGTTDELIKSELKNFGINQLQANLNNLNEVETILKKNKKIKVIYVETPSNPLLECIHLKNLATISKKYHCKLLVDNTFATPFLQRPLLLGADLSIHSTTKYLNGHGSGLGGVVIGEKKFIKEEVWKKVKLMGGNSNAWDAWLILNGMKTLELRMQRHCSNAKQVANFLSEHKAVRTVHYPALKNHPTYTIAKQQMHDFGGMLSFELKGGFKAGIAFMNHISVGNLVTTLGTTDTIFLHPASMSHVNVSKEQRLKFGIHDGLIRMSVGIENIEDILNDLENTLK